MKDSIHPEKHPVCFIDVSTGKKFVTMSSLRSKQKDIVDGVECYVVYCDVTADSHPAYTGERRLVDTAGRVEKFNQKFSRIRK
ncbi:MAG: type B 50S ribosomal protein L31 [Puniceicoccales bacterium]|jgi:large subunit ribosomal protein L31|nr:type B 50S ribosomal protein L31 [Puniceicoccales bacterium]